MAPSLRGTMTGEQCWFILINPELVLATTIIGIAPIFVVIILYSIILRKALLKIGELKSATSVVNATNGIETSGGNNLRYFVGSRVDMVAEQDQDATTAVPLRHTSKSTSLRCCCWRCSKTDESSETNIAIEGAVLTATPKRQQPSKWKAIKVVMFTTGSFVLTWVCWFFE